ncbi:MAG: ABC-2 family transporter protein [Firmicutes bacterium]|nr:ABC-2 family transporter protein [Bacillota bacterium]
MVLYLEFIKKAFQQRYAYRFDFYLSMLFTSLGLIIQVCVWSALYRRYTAINSITLTDMLNYSLISIIVSALTRSEAGNKIADKVVTGSIISDFARPVNFKYYLFAEDLGTNSFNLIFATIPACFLVVLLYRFHLSIQPPFLIPFLISLILGVVVAYEINYIFGLMAFWFKTSWYLKWFLSAFNELFAGSFVPLCFYPSFLPRKCFIKSEHPSRRSFSSLRCPG